MAKLDLDKYVGVNERVMAFRAKHPEGAISTVREADLRIEVDGQVNIFVRFKALAFRDKSEIELYATSGIPTAAGHAELELGKDKVTEKCETIAIGRALALLGFAADKSLASQEEMQEFNEHEERKAEPKTSRLGKARDVELDEDGEVEPPPARTSLRDRSRKSNPVPVDVDQGDEDEAEEAPPPKRKSNFAARR